MTQPDQQPPGQYPPPQQPYGTPNYQPQQGQPYPQQGQYPPQGQNPQVGYFGGALEPKKKGFPWWGWLIVVVVALVVIGAVASNSAKTNVNPTNQATEVTITAVVTQRTNAPVVNSAATAVVDSTPRPTQTNRPPTAAPATKEIGVRVTGAGQELIGQNAVKDDVKITITSVDRFSQITDSNGKVLQSQGAFLILVYELDNQSSKPQSIVFLSIIDGKGRTFSGTSNMDAIGAIAFSGSYKTDFSIQPTFKGKGYSLFEVPIDASNFKIKLGF